MQAVKPDICPQHVPTGSNCRAFAAETLLSGFSVLQHVEQAVKHGSSECQTFLSPFWLVKCKECQTRHLCPEHCILKSLGLMTTMSVVTLTQKGQICALSPCLLWQVGPEGRTTIIVMVRLKFPLCSSGGGAYISTHRRNYLKCHHMISPHC